MSEQATPVAAGRRADHEPVDSLVAPRRPGALSVAGERIDVSELESAAELSRLTKRVGLGTARIDPFLLYRAYLRLRRLRKRLGRGISIDS